MESRATTTSTHWCDSCSSYFSMQNPGVVLTVRQIEVRLCMTCLLAMVDGLRKMAHAKLLEVGA